jgi:hypothetical protein
MEKILKKYLPMTQTAFYIWELRGDCRRESGLDCHLYNLGHLCIGLSTFHLFSIENLLF